MRLDASDGYAVELRIAGFEPGAPCDADAQTFNYLVSDGTVSVIARVTLPHVCHTVMGPTGSQFVIDVYAHAGNPDAQAFCA